MNLYGTPNWTQNDHLCYLPAVNAQKLTCGVETVDCFEPDYARCMVLWGANPATSHLTAHWRSIQAARKKGANLIVVDPRFTRPAAQADLYLPIRPGTDTALALGWINYMIVHKLYDVEFVERWTTGFEQLAERVRPYTPEKAAAITGLDASDIRRGAELYACNRPGWLDAGNALEHHSTSSQSLRALMILRAITGNLDVPGGHVIIPELPLADVKLREKRPAGLQLLGVEQHPLFAEYAGFVPGDVLIETLLTDKPYPLKAMILGGGNPALTWPNSAKVREAFRRLGLMVVMDHYMTATAELADLVLPAASPFEKPQLITAAGPFGPDKPVWHLSLRRQIVDPGEPRSDWWFWKALAERMGYGAHFPWPNVEASIDVQLEPLGFTYQDLAESPEGLYYGDPPAYRRYEQEGFPTPSGKVELYSHVLESYGYDPLPRYEKPAESAARTPELAARCPLVLSAGRRVAVYTNARHRNFPSLRDKEPEPLAEIHPETAAQYQSDDGDRIVVESSRGAIELKAQVTDDIVPGMVSLLQAWEESNANELTDHLDCDPVLATPLLRAGLC